MCALPEPCPPQNVQTHLNCSSDVGTVSWEESLGAVAYVAFLEGRNGQSLSCYTTSSSCSVTGLICGTVYNTHVRAIGGNYNSTDSETVLLTSGLAFFLGFYFNAIPASMAIFMERARFLKKTTKDFPETLNTKLGFTWFKTFSKVSTESNKFIKGVEIIQSDKICLMD